MQELIKKLEKQFKKPISEFDKIDWVFISVNEKLSEDFIKEFQDKVIWEYIYQHIKSYQMILSESSKIK